MILLLIYIFILGTFFGSFASVIISRLKHKESGIWLGRSHCTSCNHGLHTIDLIPIFSYLSTGGTCRYCKSKVSIIYPILELSTGVLFLLSTYYMIDLNLVLDGSLIEIYKLIFYLIISFLTIVFVFYDILYLEIPDSILLILSSITYLTILLQSYFIDFNIIPTLSQSIDIYNNSTYLIILGIFGLIVLRSYYAIIFLELNEIYDILILGAIIVGVIFIKKTLGVDIKDSIILSSIVGSIIVFIFLFIQIIVSRGTWMGGGDLRIAIWIGLLMGAFFSFYGIIATYISGSILSISIVGYQKIKKYLGLRNSGKNIKFGDVEISTQVAFGPYLAIGVFYILYFYNNIESIFLYL